MFDHCHRDGPAESDEAPAPAGGRSREDSGRGVTPADAEPVAAGSWTRRRLLHAGAVSAATLAASCANSGSREPTPGGSVIIALDKVPVGGVVAVTIDRRPAFIARPDEDTVRAFSGICTHQSCTVVSAGEVLLCPCHGSNFDPLTGAVLRGPAERDLPALDVRLDGESVVPGEADPATS